MPATATFNSTNVRNSIALAWSRMHLGVASVLAPSKAVETAARLFATPPRHAHTAREQELLATGTRFDIAFWAPDQSGTSAASGVTPRTNSAASGVTPRANSAASGVTLAAWRFGAATRPAIVASHGWGGRGAQFRAFVPALLEAGYQVILFDHVGHGFSSGGESSLIHFMRGIDAVVSRVESQGANVVALIGHSLGAAAAGAWLNANKREMRTVLIAPPISIERYSGWFARKLGLPESVRSQMQQRFERRLGHRWDEFELPQSVRNVRAKALVVHDAGDREVTPASGLSLARAWPGARFLRTEGLGHRAILRDPQVATDVVDFIANRVVFSPPPTRGEASAYVEPAPSAEGDAMKKRMEEQSLRTLTLAVVGFVALLIAVPEWARAGVIVFGAIYAVLVYVLDPNVRNWIPDHRRNSGVRDDTRRRSGVRDDTRRRSGVRDDTRYRGDSALTSARAKSPAGRRAAT